jgi:hypothetical protein
MWIGIAILGYFIGVFLLIRFMQAVSVWDKEIERMEEKAWRKSGKI